MADRKTSNSRPEKSKETPGNAFSRFIRRLSPTKKYHGDETPGASSSSTSQKTDSRFGKKDSSATKNSSRKEEKLPEKLTKAFLNLPESTSSSKSSLSQPTSPWLTPAPSYQSLNTNERATELKLLSQLHANFDEATHILGNYKSLRDQKK
ncbi:ser-rich protein [Diolcogaster facetosa bracovirus]|uniref:Ser-rich protein n=1 Tax=Bracoviriform facetosae TaxID=2083300 RepID=R9XLM4_9VIRU|nr:ser-rich protein [Diolcogaster facetosa bracovirus] [Bracoviriform facetosae]YP_009665876.1 ser-rich protein [Diolcogaster facetosa bracovirus] [Bracoviriform facetosae]AGO14391.1 ser-rich protein [Diolcogaster facetosa bracovirus] [Bracoviriform facetosae]AGO14463.1 ser-rich protein [Diolcogaster facetosa bracovirus] [Bracoviriform facetosae]